MPLLSFLKRIIFKLNFSKCKIDGILIIEPKAYSDIRGVFLECFQNLRYSNIGINDVFVQENYSRSFKNVLRGMHYQIKRPQSQILTVIQGSIFDVCVDLRPHSATFRTWFGIELSDRGVRQIYMPPGVAHGYCVLSESADLHYKVSQIYDVDDEAGLKWNDVEIDIRWPLNNPIIAERDSKFPSLKEIKEERLPHSYSKE